MKALIIKTFLIAASIVSGAVGGRILARQQCIPCYNDIADGGPFGKFRSNKCYVGACQPNAPAKSWCYRETCSSCKYNDRKKTGCPSGVNFTCPAAGDCPDGNPAKPFVCQNLCGC
jgi:hypothetical protein